MKPKNTRLMLATLVVCAVLIALSSGCSTGGELAAREHDLKVERQEAEERREEERHQAQLAADEARQKAEIANWERRQQLQLDWEMEQQRQRAVRDKANILPQAEVLRIKAECRDNVMREQTCTFPNQNNEFAAGDLNAVQDLVRRKALCRKEQLAAVAQCNVMKGLPENPKNKDATLEAIVQ